MKRNIEEAYIEHCCKECENKANKEDLCNITIFNIKAINFAKCSWYKNNKRRVRAYEKMDKTKCRSLYK